MTDNFNLKKFLSENKTIQNSNPFLREESTEDKEAHLDAEKDDAAHIGDLEKDMKDDEKLDEVEVTEAETEDEDVEVEEEVEIETEETDDVGIDATEMEGDEGEILSHLMKALGMAKSMGDEKLTKQIGNTVTFLTRQFISGE
mgnify:FL=1|tara:strand:- start:1132 stop:1560 length:429 start_codon:yes stop_codon:yes gene_type:complete